MGIKVTDWEFSTMNLVRNVFRGEGSYAIISNTE